MFIFIMFLIILLVLVFYIVFYSILLSKSIDEKNVDSSSIDLTSINEYHYKKKNYVNDYDSEFINKLHPLVDEFDIEIVPNVKLIDIINRNELGDSNELNSIINFGIFTKDFKKPLLLINLNNNDIIRAICKKSRISYIEVNSYSLNDLKHIRSRISKAITR